MHRRTFLRSALGVSLGAMVTAPVVGKDAGIAPPLDVEALLFDPEAPVGGNPAGDVTIVAFFDYNCGYCKGSAPTLARLLKTDGKIRLVYKDWPILAKSSVTAARLALAAKYQHRYEAAHHAFMALPGRSMNEEGMGKALKRAGLDVARLNTDAQKHAEPIAGVLKRNNEQAMALQLPGTPVYLVGPYKVAAALDYQGLVDVVADARRRAAER
ncbi:DsbA family protein [Ancylobacter oerskovii]|uniref:DsbA family protein n=1 Tax=Ancylobacter oerskovii TaxID=459519 RepID=A0ABW4YVM8_9HYPH|nr:DsbA family protein [Ancylobacter oerskovii]MBS7544428.1 DsbA family protein [Ancylobacter oerskovii]